MRSTGQEGAHYPIATLAYSWRWCRPLGDKEPYCLPSASLPISNWSLTPTCSVFTSTESITSSPPSPHRLRFLLVPAQPTQPPIHHTISMLMGFSSAHESSCLLSPTKSKTNFSSAVKGFHNLTCFLAGYSVSQGMRQLQGITLAVSVSECHLFTYLTSSSSGGNEWAQGQQHQEDSYWGARFWGLS